MAQGCGIDPARLEGESPDLRRQAHQRHADARGRQSDSREAKHAETGTSRDGNVR